MSDLQPASLPAPSWLLLLLGALSSGSLVRLGGACNVVVVATQRHFPNLKVKQGGVGTRVLLLLWVLGAPLR
jgi:hypothetical protein